MRRRIAANGFVLLALSLAACSPSQPASHADGLGVLASTGDPGHSESGSYPVGMNDPVSLGIRLCRMSGGSAAVLRSVAGHSTIGSVRLLGTGVERFARGAVDPFASAHWFPPSSQKGITMADLTGFAVTDGCDPDDPEYTELVLGMHRADDAGGAWLGVDVTYTVDGQEHVVNLGYEYIFCGAATGDIDGCGGPPAS